MNKNEQYFRAIYPRATLESQKRNGPGGKRYYLVRKTVRAGMWSGSGDTKAEAWKNAANSIRAEIIANPIGETALDYLKSLKAGEQVIETGECCTKGIVGTIYESTSGGGTCVMWETMPKMGTSVTHGTRRLTDVKKPRKVRQIVWKT